MFIRAMPGDSEYNVCQKQSFKWDQMVIGYFHGNNIQKQFLLNLMLII